MRRISLMTGYRFNGINWRKPMAHFTIPNGLPYTVLVSGAMRAAR